MIPRMRRLNVLSVAAALAALALPSMSQAQSGSSGPGSAYAVADSFFRAWGDARWRDAARLLDLQAFGRLRDAQVHSMRRARIRRMTAEELMREAPKMPRAVAEYQAAEFNARAGRNDWLLYDYANVPSVDSLAALSVEEAAARWLEAKDQRYHVRRALEEQRSRCTVPDSVFAQMFPLPTTKYELLGTLVRDSLAYTLFDEAYDPAPADSLHSRHGARTGASDAVWVVPPSVLTLRRAGGTWRIAPGMPFGNQSSVVVANCTQMKGRRPPPRAP